MYTMEIKPQEKILLVTASGFFKMDEALQFNLDLKEKISSISNTSEYNLVINAKDQKTVAQDVQEVFEKTVLIYMSVPFKSRHTVIFASAVSKAQVTRSVSKEIAEKFEYHDTVEEALRCCK